MARYLTGVLWSRRPNELSPNCLSGESRSAKSRHLAIHIMHVTAVHRALRDYVGSGLARAGRDTGVIITDNGGACSMSLAPSGIEMPAGRQQDMAIVLDGESTPFFLNCVPT